ncbi:cytospin-A isoform X2 [Rhipicephalus microplus]|uniref:cytospin-A isoform X2 n=1 Tax=Rhipicephalus microplus TaxID=6941 RepID=UPI003F6BACB9
MMRNAGRTVGGTLRSAGNSALPQGLSALQQRSRAGQESIFAPLKKDSSRTASTTGAARTRTNRPMSTTRSDPVNKENMLSRGSSGARKCGSIKSSSSKDSLDSNGQTKEHKKAHSGLGQPTVGTQTSESAGKASPTTILQLEREKSLLEQQVSELVRNAESKKAEIATLRMEIKHLKESSGGSRQLEALQLENCSLREKLVQLGVEPAEASGKQDPLQRSASAGSLDGAREQAKSVDGALSDDAGPSGSRQEWDKASTSSLSEMSVACLQDRIMQMEETHYSTNEELQATLQELTDLQDQLTDLQMENERCCDEKALLLESLCSQTEKLEECRSHNDHLRALLFGHASPPPQVSSSSSTPAVEAQLSREQHYVELLKKAHEEQTVLRGQVEQLQASLEVASREAQDHQRDLQGLAHRVSLLQAALEAAQAASSSSAAPQGEGDNAAPILDGEAQVVDSSSQVSHSARWQEEERKREEALQEQLAVAQREAARLSQLLAEVQEETQAAHAQVSALEQRVEQLEAEKAQLHEEAEARCQRLLEEKRQLRATLAEMSNSLADNSALLGAARRDLDDLHSQHVLEKEEWKRFEADLLTTVRVANDFKTEAQQEVERLQCDNQQLQEKLEALEAQLAKLKSKQELSPKAHSSSVDGLSEGGAGVQEGMPLSTPPRSSSSGSSRPLSKWSDLRAGSSSSSSSAQHSVRSLIESIENATKQAKGPSSRSSSTSSLNSLASDSRSAVAAANALLLGNAGDILAKSPFKVPEKVRLAPRPSQQQPIQRPDTAGESTAEVPTRTEADKAHPVSILAHKLEPIRRNSYSLHTSSDLSFEKKDPLASLVKGGGSKRNALLKWCQNKTMGYKNIDITNFSSSWNDGLAFCALLHTYLGDKIPYDQLDSKDKRRNFSIAFEAAESAGIPSTLNVNELICLERPDWQSIMGYVTSIYKHFET